MMAAAVAGLVLASFSASAQNFIVYKTSASVTPFNQDGSTTDGKIKKFKVTTYTIVDTKVETDNVYSIWFGKVGKAKVVAGRVTTDNGDPAFNDYRDMFRGYDTMTITNKGGSTGFWTSIEGTIGDSGFGQFYSGKVNSKGLLTPLKGAYIWYNQTGADGKAFTSGNSSVTVNRSLTYDKKMTGFVAAATTMQEASNLVVQNMKGYASL